LLKKFRQANLTVLWWMAGSPVTATPLNGFKVIIRKILVFALLVTLLFVAAIYVWMEQVFNDYEPKTGRITFISYTDTSGRGSTAKTLVVILETDVAGEIKQVKISDGHSDERPYYAEAHKSGDQVTFWRSRSNKKDRLIRPSEPRLFSLLYLLFPSVGVISAVVGAIIFGERIDRKANRV
jgi:hypothetical protein